MIVIKAGVTLDQICHAQSTESDQFMEALIAAMTEPIEEGS